MISDVKMLVDEPDCYLAVLEPSRIKYRGDKYSPSEYLRRALEKILLTYPPFEHPQLKMFGKSVRQSRSSVMYSDRASTYNYSGYACKPLPLTNTMKGVFAFINNKALSEGVSELYDESWASGRAPENCYLADGFNWSHMNDRIYTYDSVMVNKYDGHKQNIGWHSDSIDDLQYNSPIMTLSSDPTYFEWKKKQSKAVEVYYLRPMSIVIMGGSFQEKFQHRVMAPPKGVVRHSFVFRCFDRGMRKMKWPRVMNEYSGSIYENHRLFRLQICTITDDLSLQFKFKLKGFSEQFDAYCQALNDLFKWYRIPIELVHLVYEHFGQVYFCMKNYFLRNIFEYTP